MVLNCISLHTSMHSSLLTSHLGPGMSSDVWTPNIFQNSDPLSLLSHLFSLHLFTQYYWLIFPLEYQGHWSSTLTLHQHLAYFYCLPIQFISDNPKFQAISANILNSLCPTGLQYGDRATDQPWMNSTSYLCVSIWGITNTAEGKPYRTLKIHLIWVLNFTHRHLSSHLTNSPSILLLSYYVTPSPHSLNLPIFLHTFLATYFSENRND